MKVKRWRKAFVTGRQLLSPAKLVLPHREHILNNFNFSCVEMFEKLFTDEVYEHVRIGTKIRSFQESSIAKYFSWWNKMFHWIPNSQWIQSVKFQKIIEKSNLKLGMKWLFPQWDAIECNLRYIHCTDNNIINRQDNLWKLRPRMNIIKIITLVTLAKEIVMKVTQASWSS